MMNTHRDSRQILSMENGSREDLADAIQNIFVAELLNPSSEIWLVSPWVSDVNVIDNRTGKFTGLLPDFPQRWIHLTEVLSEIISRKSSVNLVTRPNAKGSDNSRNEQFFTQLTNRVAGDGNQNRLRTVFSSDLHIKGLLTDKIFLSGSMNFTFFGLRKSEELIRISATESEIATASLSFRQYWNSDD